MRKIVVAAALVFAFAFALGVAAPAPVEAASDCFYTCSCTGTPLRCCETSTGGVACKPTNDIRCPQIITC